MIDKSHWYDGSIYDRFIAPNQDSLFQVIRRCIPEASTVLDVGCGTGRLALQLAGHCRLSHGIDLSSRNIRRATANWMRSGSPGEVRFYHTTLEEHLRQTGSRYGFALTTYVVHEVPEQARVPMLRMMADAAEFVLLGDYRVPRVRGLYNVGIELVEFGAGQDHYRGFRSFVRNRGLRGLIDEAGLCVVQECEGTPPSAELLMVRRKG